MKSWALEKLSIAFIDKLSSNKMTVLAGTSPEAAVSFFSFPHWGSRPSAPRAVPRRQAIQSSPQSSLVLRVNATMIKKIKAARGKSKKKRKEFQSITTSRASARARRAGIKHRIIRMIHCSNWICFRFLRRTDSSK